ncbi:hypothetical protein BC938DRAFT_471119 [Jimgerdemannia flammicorona]|uniref:Uncharacterized protein n=1 Tax=Jimgerdemannia flammicorona TaxID=994334 RepID=A0A433QUT0_9FUNG|nr:hypothetical protein BC938DRAFT_471119 [Jimgerdemannia flammicorona]
MAYPSLETMNGLLLSSNSDGPEKQIQGAGCLSKGEKNLSEDLVKCDLLPSRPGLLQLLAGNPGSFKVGVLCNFIPSYPLADGYSGNRFL